MHRRCERPREKLIDCIVGARPNFIKIAPLMAALAAYGEISARLIHTGQHYDLEMNAVFFEELGIPKPDINLEIGPGTGTEQTARVMLALEPIWKASPPRLVVVVGDVNSTLASALAAARLEIPVAHVEAGLRSNDRSMPEEINRLLTDRISSLFFATEISAVANLRREGVDPSAIFLVGNVMIDTLYNCLDRAIPARQTLREIGGNRIGTATIEDGFGFVTLHRPSNVDDPKRLAEIIDALVRISRDIPLIFPLHPRTRAMIAKGDLFSLLDRGAIIWTSPLSYLRTIGLLREARFAITDSGGVQEETTALNVPCLTFRENTERPITIEQGTNRLIGTSPVALVAAAKETIAGIAVNKGRIPPFWDGKAADRIAAEVNAFLESSQGSPRDHVQACR